MAHDKKSAGDAAAEAEEGAGDTTTGETSVDPLLAQIGAAIGLTDEEIADEVRKMLDGDDKPKNPAHMDAAEGFTLVTAPDAVAQGLGQRKMVGYVIIMVNEDMQSVACYNIGYGLPAEIRNTIMSGVVCGLELIKLRLLAGSI